MKATLFRSLLLCALLLPSCYALASPGSLPHRFRIDKRSINNLLCLSNCGRDAGEPLYLTPYIERGQIEEGRSAAAVKELPGAGSNHGGFSGFLTVNASSGSNSFFWSSFKSCFVLIFFLIACQVFPPAERQYFCSHIAMVAGRPWFLLTLWFILRNWTFFCHQRP